MADNPVAMFLHPFFSPFSLSGFLFALVLTGCGGNDFSNPNQGTVKPHSSREGVYLVYYRYHQMIDEFGPGVEAVRQNVREAGSIEDKLAVWDDALEIAVPKYLEANRLVPPECVNGVHVISSLGDEDGGGTTAFRCK
jgi:hypothetical protein